MITALHSNHSIAGTAGAANTVGIAVPGIRASDVILAIIREKDGEAPAGVAVSTFTATADTITSASVDTAGYHLVVIWAHRN